MGTAARVRATKWLLRGADMCGPASIQNAERQADVRRISAVLSGGTAVHQLSRTKEHAPDRARLNLLLKHCFDLPDLFFNFASGVFGFAFSL